MRAIMIQGCTSHAGKSYLTAALCRFYSNAGLRVAPFKAQNMSNNAGVTPNGLEMGRAQLVQAAAARVRPDVRMNPVLLKPQSGGSQVVVLGKADPNLTALPWRERKPLLWPIVNHALHSLMSEYDLLLIEGAGSPAEINLRSGDIVNMRVAKEANAAVLLTTDIDRGGAFAHLLGTWHCLEPAERALLRGFILNRFRGDASLLHPAPSWLEQQTGIPTVAVIPELNIALPEEDSVGSTISPLNKTEDNGFIALIALPHAANTDEFAPLFQALPHQVHWIRKRTELLGARSIIIPGSKATLADLDWLRKTGLAAEITREAASGLPVLGICGGLQMLGKHITDPLNIESGGEGHGLALLPLETEMAAQKITLPRQITEPETGYLVSGYEIHHGRTNGMAGEHGLFWRAGNVRGTYLHGLFENAAYVRYWAELSGLEAGEVNSLDARLETLSARVAEQFSPSFLHQLAQIE